MLGPMVRADGYVSNGYVLLAQAHEPAALRRLATASKDADLASLVAHAQRGSLRTLVLTEERFTYAEQDWQRPTRLRRLSGGAPDVRGCFVDAALLKLFGKERRLRFAQKAGAFPQVDGLDPVVIWLGDAFSGLLMPFAPLWPKELRLEAGSAHEDGNGPEKN